MSKALTSIAIVLCMVIAACAYDDESTSLIEASSCFVVEPFDTKDDVQSFDYGRRVSEFLEEFVKIPDRESHGGEFVYREPSIGVQISLVIGMGANKASVALFSDDEKNCRICLNFEEFMEDWVGKHFTVKQCEDVNGFGVPKLINVDLRKP
jgi:hypothetical protein